MSSESPIPHPDWVNLREICEALRSQIATALAERHVLEASRTVVLGRYAEAFGERMTRLHELEIEAARLKREIELIQANLNAGREIDFDGIQDTLEAEFAEWQSKLEDEAREMEKQRAVLDHLLDPETSRELRRLYRVLVRRLHPDLNPDQSEASVELWHQVRLAHDFRDLGELQALDTLTNDDDAGVPADSADSLRSFEAKLREQLENALQKMADLRKTWPFDQLPLLNDKVATVDRQTELDGRIEAARALCGDRRTWLNQLLNH